MLGVITVCLSIPGVTRAQTVLWSENFDDGNGNNRWAADAGVWQIGSPTIGPSTNSAGYRTHSGPDCATTGLTANYPAGANSRLFRIQSFTVPAASQFPRLRFWHWFSFGSTPYVSSYGVVEVRVGTGSWSEVSPRYYGSGGDWSYSSVDLSAYAGQTVQVAFQIVAPYDGNGNSGVGPGWYVDDIALLSGTPVFNNPEGFEVGIGDWYAENGTWQVGTPTKSGGAPTNASGAQAHLGTNCAVTILKNNYPAGVNSRYISPAFILPPASMSPFLRFWHSFSFGSTPYVSSYGVVEIRVGTGAWSEVSQHYTGNSAIWSEPFVDLTAYGGQTVQLAFQIVAPYDGNGNSGIGSGWYVDDIQVYPNTISASTPYMKIIQSGTNIILNWTYLPNYTGFTLQSATNLVTQTNWNTVSPAPVVVNGQNTVTNPISGTQKFFRLSQ
jgi:hypothetical protein